jgi:hypothetical protein
MARSGNNTRITSLGRYPMTSAPTFGTDLTEVVDDIAPLIGEEDENVSDLPETGTWVGRTIFVQAVRGLYTRRLGSWIPMSAQTCLAGLAGSFASGQSPDATTSGSNSISDASIASVGTNAIIIGRTGMYRVELNLSWTSNSNGARAAEITRNNASMSPRLGDRKPANGESFMSASGLRRLNQGDALRVTLQQDSGSTLNYGGQLSVEWVHA